MSSDKQIDANRRNAQHSTGPTTQAGKEAVRGNALKHGLTAKTLTVIAPELVSQFNQLVHQYKQYYKPQGPMEEELVMNLARLSWLMQDSFRLIFEATLQFMDDPDALSKVMSRYASYSSRLMKLQKDTLSQLTDMQQNGHGVGQITVSLSGSAQTQAPAQPTMQPQSPPAESQAVVNSPPQAAAPGQAQAPTATPQPEAQWKVFSTDHMDSETLRRYNNMTGGLPIYE